MAINDNDNYTLTGAQVKDLASKVNAKEDSADLAAVAETGDYDDLTNKPTIPTATSDLTNDGSDGTSTYVEVDDLAAVATSGSYTDLTDKPTIPTVNNATLTIQKNGSTVETFTANASANVTANITVPTALSQLSGTISTSQIADGAVTKAKLNSNLQVWELILDTRLPASTETTYDIAVNFSTYDTYHIRAMYVSGRTAGFWDAILALNASKAGLNTEQNGIELQGTNVAGISRTQTNGEMVAWGAATNRVSALDFTISAINGTDWPHIPFWGQASGADKVQFMQGKVRESAANVKYLRLTLPNGIAANQNKIQIYATRRRG